jgi:hypothetical protein
LSPTSRVWKIENLTDSEFNFYDSWNDTHYVNNKAP